MACQGNLTCTNTVGSYTCSCPSDAAGECEHPCTALHGVTSKTPRLQKAESASCIVYSHPTGESLGCGTACRSRSCPEGFCSNGGRCHLHPPSCTPTCECPPAFTDRHCVVAGGDFQPQASAGGCCAPRGAEAALWGNCSSVIDVLGAALLRVLCGFPWQPGWGINFSLPSCW